MKGDTKIKVWGGICIIAVLFMGYGANAQSQEDFVRAKVGVLIKSGEKVVRAKSKSRVHAGDLVRIYVHPEKSAYVYIVHMDKEIATLLNAEAPRVGQATLVLPSVQDYYEVDGKSSIENITVICSPKELRDVSGLLKSGTTERSQWETLENRLYEKSKIDLTSQAERPFVIAGNVRGGTGPGDPFLKKLRIYTGKSLLVKRYELRVEK